ncbi:MAG: RNA-binding domain-containing protein [Pseudomonadota bacterium]
MDPIELRERISRWENLHTDFKESVGSPDELAKDLVCFANTNGGQIIVGVADDRTIAGVVDRDPVHRQVDNVAFNNCEPPITVVQETVEIDGKTVVVINVPKGSQRPYRTNRGRYYVRTTSGCRDASREELLRLFQAVESLYYDETPLPRLTVGDLDLDALDHFLEKTAQKELGDDPPRLLKAWGLLSAGHPTMAGFLLFGRNPQKHLPYAQINAARFPGTDVAAAPSDRKDLGGRLLDMIDDAQRFLRLHLRLPHEIHGFEPEPRPEMPEEVLREAIVNAVAHRDYTIQGPIRLFVFDDRIEIHTPGKPPNSVDAEAMRAGVHVVRNPRIYARLSSDAGLATRAGTGVPRIVKLVRNATGKDVGLEVRDFEVLLSIPRKASLA